ncbi:MAG TPA: hypothetical protein DCW68_06935 [Rhodospirillaceae bacterium]|nr:hypothetical protein [Rhodospirillaceae bacterium]
MIIEFHRWEGISFAARHDLFHSCLRLGFISILISRHRISEKLRRLVNNLDFLKSAGAGKAGQP